MSVSDKTLQLCSINQWTVKTTPMQQFVQACSDLGIRHVGLWRQNIAELGLPATKKLIDDAGLSVTTLCRGGFFTTPDPAEHDQAIADNKQAIDEAVELGTKILVLVPGGLQRGQDIADARARVTDSIAEIAEYAGQAGIGLAIEPMHPIFAADRGVVSTIDEALQIAAQVDSPAVGVVIDSYHTWWDPQLLDAVQRTGQAGRLLSYQVADWCLPLHEDPLTSRGYMGDGYIDFAPLNRAIAATGYTEPVEVEIFNDQIWAQPVHEALTTVLERFDSLVTPDLNETSET